MHITLFLLREAQQQEIRKNTGQYKMCRAHYCFAVQHRGAACRAQHAAQSCTTSNTLKVLCVYVCVLCVRGGCVRDAQQGKAANTKVPHGPP